MKNFFSKLDAIDRLLEEGSGPITALKLISIITESASAYYAFTKIGPDWLEPLESTGYFRGLSESEGADPMATARLIGPATGYLKRLAGDDQISRKTAESIRRVISFIPSLNNFYVFRDIVETAILLPSDLRRDLVPSIQREVDKINVVIEHANVVNLMSTLAEDGEVAAALRLFTSLFAVFSSATTSAAQQKRYFSPDVVAFMDAWNYKNQLDKCFPVLAQKAGLRFLSRLCRLLSDCIHITSSSGRFQGPDDYSYIWRPAIEGHSQNHSDDIRDALVSATRDCAVQILKEQPSQFFAVIETLEAEQWFIFTRIILHLIAESHAAPLALISYYSTQPLFFSEVGLRHEYALLLKNRYSFLSEVDREKILGLIDNGPDKISYVRHASKAFGGAPTEEQLGSYVQHWQLEWLSFLDKNLTGAWKELYEQLIAKFEKPAHPEFPYYMSGGFQLPSGSIGSVANVPPERSTAPLDWEYFRSMIDGDPSDAVVLTKAFDYLHAIAQSDRLSLLRDKHQVCNLPSRYLAELVNVLSSHFGNESADIQAVLLDFYLELSKRIPESPEDINDASKRALTSAIESILRLDEKSLERVHVETLTQVASNLLASVTVEDFEGAPSFSDDFDPLLSAINQAAGRIVECSIRVALLEKKRFTEDDGQTQAWLLTKLSALLDVMPADAVTMVSIFGYRFPWLVSLSKNWAEQYATTIFPSEEGRRWIWESAWCTYIAHCNPFDDVFDVLSAQYMKAINEVAIGHKFKKSRLKPEDSLARHLAVFYWRKKLTLADRGTISFLENASAETIESFLAFIGRGMKDVQTVPDDVVTALQELADWMFDKWRPRIRNARKALAAFGWWFPRRVLGDSRWRLRLLKRSIRGGRIVKDLFEVLPELTNLAGTNPDEVVDCLKTLVSQSSEEVSSHHLAEKAYAILKIARDNANVDRRRAIGEIADHLGAQGHLHYREFAFREVKPQTV